MGHEKSLTALIPALAGANAIYGMGLTDLAVTFSFTQLVIDDMIVGKIKGLIGGDKRRYDPEWFSYLIKKDFQARLGTPQGGRKRMPPVEQFFPSVPDIVSEARQKIQNILNYHKPEPLSPAVQRKIREIIIEEEDRKAGRQRMVQL